MGVSSYAPPRLGFFQEWRNGSKRITSDAGFAYNQSFRKAHEDEDGTSQGTCAHPRAYPSISQRFVKQTAMTTLSFEVDACIPRVSIGILDVQHIT